MKCKPARSSQNTFQGHVTDKSVLPILDCLFMIKLINIHPDCLCLRHVDVLAPGRKMLMLFFC